MTTPDETSEKETISDDAAYEKWVRAKSGHRHIHAWIRWEAWETNSVLNPHRGATILLVCDVPFCLATRVLPRSEVE